MSIYFDKKRKHWRYEFQNGKDRITGRGFKTKKDAQTAMVQYRKEVSTEKDPETVTDMAFFDLVSVRLDHVKAYNSETHYETHKYMARVWVRQWPKARCSEVTPASIRQFLLKRRKVSAYTANRELRYLRAMFNFGVKHKYVPANPTEGIEFFPVEKRIRYVPPVEDIRKVLDVVEQDIQDYLVAIWHTMARVSEINRLTWEDVNLDERYVVLYTRKKRGGHLTPRKVHMTGRLYEVMERRFRARDKKVPWVFVASYKDWKNGEKVKSSFLNYRRTILKTACKRADVRIFTFHALRHSGASIMDNANVPTGAIQRILGHENRTTTEIYLHSLGEVERQAISVFEGLAENHTQNHTHPL